MEGIPAPRINWDSSNLVDEWEKFERHVKLIFDGPLKEKDEEQKVSYLLLWVGDRGREIRHSWKDISADDEKKLQTYYSKFQKYVQPKLNPIFARYKFYHEIQGTDTFDAFLTRLRIRVRDCKFDKPDEMIRDRIVFGINTQRIREKLINEGDQLNLDKTISIVQNMEYCKMQMNTMAIRVPSMRLHINKTRRKNSINHQTRACERPISKVLANQMYADAVVILTKRTQDPVQQKDKNAKNVDY